MAKRTWWRIYHVEAIWTPLRRAVNVIYGKPSPLSGLPTLSLVGFFATLVLSTVSHIDYKSASVGWWMSRECMLLEFKMFFIDLIFPYVIFRVLRVIGFAFSRAVFVSQLAPYITGFWCFWFDVLIWSFFSVRVLKFKTQIYFTHKVYLTS